MISRPQLSLDLNSFTRHEGMFLLRRLKRQINYLIPKKQCKHLKQVVISFVMMTCFCAH